jgi:hypothetical protein
MTKDAGSSPTSGKKVGRMGRLGIYKSDGFQQTSCRNCLMAAGSVWTVTQSVVPGPSAMVTRFLNHSR